MYIKWKMIQRGQLSIFTGVLGDECQNTKQCEESFSHSMCYKTAGRNVGYCKCITGQNRIPSKDKKSCRIS